MAWSKVTRTPITGLTASGAIDGSGTWNLSVPIGDYVTVPSGATGVILWVYNTISSDRWSGVRTSGKSTPLFLADGKREVTYTIAPMGAGNTVDLYTENTANVVFDIVGFVDMAFFDIDAPLPTVASTGSSMINRDLSGSIPEGAIAAVFHNFDGMWRPTGTSDAMTRNARGTAIIPLDAARTVDLDTGSDQTLLGYITSGVEFTTWPPTSETVTDDSTWRDYPVSDADAEFVFVVDDKSAAGIYSMLRPEGDTFDPALVQSTHNCLLCPTGTGGAIEYKAESGGTHAYKTIAWFPTATSGGSTFKPFWARNSNVVIQ